MGVAGKSGGGKIDTTVLEQYKNLKISLFFIVDLENILLCQEMGQLSSKIIQGLYLKV